MKIALMRIGFQHHMEPSTTFVMAAFVEVVTLLETIDHLLGRNEMAPFLTNDVWRSVVVHQCQPSKLLSDPLCQKAA
jgi:hypothetical protein